MTSTNSANVTPTAAASVGVHTTENVGARSRAAVRAERRAWVILWVAFFTFCALAFAAVKFAVEYVSTAQVDQSARVTASRGPVIVNLPGNSDMTLLGARSELGVGTLVALDRTSVANVDLQFFDDSRINVLGGASIELTRMEIGRFINQHSLVLTQTSGPIRYATGGPMDVLVPNGSVQLAPHGDYTVWIDGEVTRVLVYGGEAHLSAGGAGVNVGDGRLAEIDPQGQVRTADRPVPLLANSDFSLHDQNWLPWDINIPGLDVNGQRFWVAGPPDLSPESTALRVVRVSRSGEHGETGLVQKLDRDVSGFRHLWLRAWVRVDYADLSGGGQLGSEYPMMLQMKYEGPVEHSWIPWSVGLYYATDRPVPFGVASQVPQGEWHAYEVDLMATEASNIPYRLLEFAVMGQGHSYDARIADISLIGD
ncbi:MAG: hypothetical protein M3069_13090 [Chloroflexota bacterium]|nr:hypothetical protein [Chloroflexota bacterium]